MEQEFTVLRDVELRLRALAEVQRLRPLVINTQEQLMEAKQCAADASPGTATEQRFLREAAEASQRLADLQAELGRKEQELRRTRYLLQLLQE